MCSNEEATVPGSTHTGTMQLNRRIKRSFLPKSSYHCYSSNNLFDAIIIRAPTYTGRTAINLTGDSRPSAKLLQLFGFLVVLALLPTTSMAHPLNDGTRSSNGRSSRGQDGKSYWTNPCRGNVPTASSERRSSDQLVPADKDTLDAIYMTTSAAKKQAEKFRDQYVMKTFNMTLREHHGKHRLFKYDWLRNNFVIPKDLNETVAKEHLDKLISQPQEEVLKIYGFLQRLAVAFQQIIKDNADDNAAFKKEFEEAKNHLGEILCEIRDFFDDDRMKSYEDATFNTMPEEFRHLSDHSHRDMRDWLIFRDYMNLLEYILQVMGYFRKTITIA